MNLPQPPLTPLPNPPKYFLSEKFRQRLAKRWGLREDLTLFDAYSRRVAFTLGFTVIGVIVLFILGGIYLLVGNPERAIVDFVFAILALANLGWVRVRRVGMATGTILTLMFALSTILLTSGGLAGTGFLWLFTIPILALFLEGARRGLRWTLAGIGLILCILIGAETGFLQTAYSRAEFLQIALVFFTISILVFVYETITERYELAWSRQEQELKKFKQATDSAGDGIVITETNGNIVYVNEAWEELTGYTAAEVRGKNPKILKSGKTPEKLYTSMWRQLTRGKSFLTEDIINRRKDGREYQAQLEVFPIQDEQRNVFYVGLEQDISERKAIDRAKSEFVSLASHQLTTPLSAMSWFTELLGSPSAGGLTKKQRHLVKRIGDSTAQMTALVNALLNVSRIDLGTFAIHPIPTDINRTIEDMVAQIKASASEYPRFLLEFPKRQLRFRVDPVLFQIVVQNLLTNAVRYTPPSGKITIKLTRVKSGFEISVRDSGIGIPSEQQEKIFTKMFRASNASERVPNGNGLGLYIVKAIVDQSGGKISFTSEMGKGSVFTVAFPGSGMKKKTGNRQLSLANWA